MKCCKKRDIEFLGTQCPKKILFKFLDIVNTANLKRFAKLLHTQHNPTAGAIRESTYGFPDILRQFRFCSFDFEIVPFYVT